MISAIMPALNEGGYIENTLVQLQKAAGSLPLEIIVVDAQSVDGTASIAKKYAKVLTSKPGRAKQMNLGAAAAHGEILFFVHADMSVPEGAFEKIIEAANSGYAGGGFANQFDRHNKRIKRLGHLINLRVFNKQESSQKCLFFGDNGIFIKKPCFLELGGFKDFPIMEDYDFSKRMKAKYPVVCITKPSLVLSARRHEKSGFLQTRLQWVLIKWLFVWGVSPNWLIKLYKPIR